MKPLYVVSILLGSAVAGVITSLLVYGPSLKNPHEEVKKAAFQHMGHSPLSFVSQIKNQPREGEKIVHEFCEACHSKEPVIPVNAPSMGVSRQWKPYREIPLHELLAVTKKGLGAMPARGGCFECSDEQLEKAISFMLNESK